MSDNRQWVALLTDDEDDYAYWQFGFANWASHLRMEWFKTGDSFFAWPGLRLLRPSVLLLDAWMSTNDEFDWLKKVVSHEYCQGLPVIMLSDQLLEEQKQGYLDIGATDCLLKPVGQQELQHAIITISQYTPNKAL